MEDDRFALVEKIIKDIENVMAKNADLYAFDIVPADNNIQNKSPVLHMENCLGLESWCIKHVYMYCYNELMDMYFTKSKLKNLSLKLTDSEKLKRLLNLTLLLNPELSTFWNKRREMSCKFLLDSSSELLFTKLVLSRKPKCNDAFGYRRWLLEKIFQDKTTSQNNILNLINEELSICELAADKSPNNYHSWNHRMWVLNTAKKLPSFDINLLYTKEFGFTELWTPKHVSDYSCFHYRQFCIRNIFTIVEDSWNMFVNSAEINFRKRFVDILVQNLPQDVILDISEETLLMYSEKNLIDLVLGYARNCNCIKDVVICRKLEILFYELAFNSELLRFYKHHETLWYHRRFVIHEVMLIIYEFFGLVRTNGSLTKKSCHSCNLGDLIQKQVKIVKYDSDRIYSSVLFNVLLSHEKKFAEERWNESDKYAERHKGYLRFVEGWNNVISD